MRVAEMTGIYVRIMRDGKAQNLEIEDLSDQELAHFFSGVDSERRLTWCVGLARELRRIKEALSADASMRPPRT